MKLELVVLILLLKTVTASWSILQNKNRQWVEKHVKAFDFDKWLEDVDANKDGIITNEECQNVVAKGDADSDGKTRQCEWIPFIWKNYNISPLISQFIFIDHDGLLNFTKGFELAVFDSNKDGKVNVDEFREREQAYIRRIANLAYEAINGPIPNYVEDPELTPESLFNTLSKYDNNENGYIDPLDFDFSKPAENRCVFVDRHVKDFGSTHWFWNYVFTLLDEDREEIFGEKLSLKCMTRADADKDGMDTIQEHTDFVVPLLRSARLLSGLPFEISLQCPGQEINPDSVIVKMAVDMDHDQDGVITPKELLDHFLHFTDDNGDSLVQMSEFTDRLIRRYGIQTDLAVELFKSLDVNKDGILDVRAEFPWYSLDYNLDGFYTVCEAVRAWHNFMELGKQNLKSTLADCQAGSATNKHTLWSEFTNQRNSCGSK